MAINPQTAGQDVGCFVILSNGSTVCVLDSNSYWRSANNHRCREDHQNSCYWWTFITPTSSQVKRLFERASRNVSICISTICSIQCDKTTRSGDALVFTIVLRYPTEFSCRTLVCQIQFFTKTIQKINTVFQVTIKATDGRPIDFELCRVDRNPNLNDANADTADFILFGE